MKKGGYAVPNVLSRVLLGFQGRKLARCIESELAENFLSLLLKAMGVAFFLLRDFRKNIVDFEGKYFFKSRDNGITVAAVFKDGEMTVKDTALKDPDVTVTFKDAAKLRDFLLAPKQDILGSMLRQDITINGNLNYLYKFAYMAKHLQLMVTGKA
jgi:hypothetical protein